MGFIRELISTARNIEWPDKKTLIKSLFAVLSVSAIITAYLVGLDTLFIYLRNLILFR